MKYVFNFSSFHRTFSAKEKSRMSAHNKSQSQNNCMKDQQEKAPFEKSMSMPDIQNKFKKKERILAYEIIIKFNVCEFI